MMYRINLISNTGTIASATFHNKHDARSFLNFYLQNEWDCILRVIGPVSIHQLTFNHNDYVHSND